MSENTKGLVAVLVVGGLAYALYSYFYGTKKTVLKYQKAIYPNQNWDYWYNTKTKKFNKNLAKSIRKDLPFFFADDGTKSCTIGASAISSENTEAMCLGSFNKNHQMAKSKI
jgi:hypothetical protein